MRRSIEDIEKLIISAEKEAEARRKDMIKESLSKTCEEPYWRTEFPKRIAYVEGERDVLRILIGYLNGEDDEIGLLTQGG